MKKTIPLILAALLFICSCKGPGKSNNSINTIENMKSYSAVADITVYGNKGNSNYKVKQDFKEPRKLRIETIEPEFLKGKLLVYGGEKWKIYNPLIDEVFEVSNLKGDEELIYLGIVQKSLVTSESAKVGSETINGKRYTKIESILPSANDYRNSAVLYINKDNGCPEYMEILDINNKVRVLIKYSQFVYNRNLQDSLFNLN